MIQSILSAFFCLCLKDDAKNSREIYYGLLPSSSKKNVYKLLGLAILMTDWVKMMSWEKFMGKLIFFVDLKMYFGLV